MRQISTQQGSFIEVLPQVDAGDHSYVNRCLRLPPAPVDSVGCHELPQHNLRQDLIGRCYAAYPGCNRQAVVSMWFQIYVDNLLPPVFAASFARGRAVPVEPAGTRALFSEGWSEGFVVASEGGPAGGDGFVRFGCLLQAHLEPLVIALAEWGRSSPRLLWSSVAGSIQTVASAAEHPPFDLSEAAACADQLLEAPTFPDGRSNPLRGLTRFSQVDAGHRERFRRVCCLRHFLPDLDTCPGCPTPLQRRPTSHDQKTWQSG
jgi:ferric iron reductase protein FhuF